MLTQFIVKMPIYLTLTLITTPCCS